MRGMDPGKAGSGFISNIKGLEIAVLSEKIKSKMGKNNRRENLKGTRRHTCVDLSYGPKPRKAVQISRLRQ
jgi:C4-type Zn-finger protein